MEQNIKYGLNAELETGKFLAYGLQHMILLIANAAVMPVIVARGFGLDGAEISSMLLRTFFICGILCILQTRFGHRYPIIDGPSGMWLTVMIGLASVTSAMGGDFAVLRTQLTLGMIISGLIVVGLGFSGRMKYIARLFTPLVNGVFLILMPIQISKSLIAGMLGTVYGGTEIDYYSFAAFWVTVAAMILVYIFATPFIKSIAILIGIAVGWIFAVIIGIGAEHFGEPAGSGAFFVLPEIFAWGTPTFNPGILLTCIIGSFLLFANFFASTIGMADLLHEEFTEKQINRGTAFFGVTTIMTGAFCTIGFVPFATSIGIVRMTSVATRKPFYLGSAIMIILGVIGPVGLFFAAIPPAVGYGSLSVLFAIIVKQGTDSIKKAELTERKGFAFGLSLLIGTGLMMQPFELFSSIPTILEPFLSNGLLVGVVLSIILEQALKERKNVSS